MIVLTQLILAITVALALSLALVLVFRWERPTRQGPWASFVFLFTMLFLFTWAAGLWLSPFGPTVWNVYWMPFGLAGLGLALLLASTQASSGRRSRRKQTNKEPENPDFSVATAFGISFWLLAIALVIAIAAHYLS